MGWFYRLWNLLQIMEFAPDVFPRNTSWGALWGSVTPPSSPVFTKLGYPIKNLMEMHSSFGTTSTQAGLPNPYQTFPEKLFPGGTLFGSLLICPLNPISTRLDCYPEKSLLEISGDFWTFRTQRWLSALLNLCQKFSWKTGVFFGGDGTPCLKLSSCLGICYSAPPSPVLIKFGGLPKKSLLETLHDFMASKTLGDDPPHTFPNQFSLQTGMVCEPVFWNQKILGWEPEPC